jgi:hypothetical protein
VEVGTTESVQDPKIGMKTLLYMELLQASINNEIK